jgi:hypothetical protein
MAEQTESRIVDDELDLSAAKAAAILSQASGCSRSQGIRIGAAPPAATTSLANIARRSARRSTSASRWRFDAKNARQFSAYSRRCTGDQRHTIGHALRSCIKVTSRYRLVNRPLAGCISPPDLGGSPSPDVEIQ